MGSVKDPDEPGKDDVYKAEFANLKEEAEFINDNEEWYSRHLNDFQCTILCQLYRETLRSLNSPLAEAVREDMPEFNRELLEYIQCFSGQAEDHKGWVDPQISARIDAEELMGIGKNRRVLEEEHDSDEVHEQPREQEIEHG